MTYGLFFIKAICLVLGHRESQGYVENVIFLVS